uniref:Uncharacterized protein n=1 Tax=Triticum urartu TaxID=4572 RepID=A0A8R7R646_TRIUA
HTVLQLPDEADEPFEIRGRRPRLRDIEPQLLRHGLGHPLDLVGHHDLPDCPLHGTFVADVLHVQPCPPHGIHEAAVGLLVEEEGPAHHRQALDGTLQRRVPSCVCQEAANRPVPQHIA